MVTITRGLLSVLRERAADRDPDAVNVVLDASPASDLDWTENHSGDVPDSDTPGDGDTSDRTQMGAGDTADLDPTTPVLTHFYLPEAAASVSAVFGMDLGRPSGAARFLSHPSGRQGITEADDLAAAVFVATPPYGEDDVEVYDRRGRRQSLQVVDAAPPEEPLTDPLGEPLDGHSTTADERSATDGNSTTATDGNSTTATDGNSTTAADDHPDD